jgi:hypothetical protein
LIKRNYIAIISILIITIFILTGCSGNDSSSVLSTSTKLYGTITDQNDSPIKGAIVSLGIESTSTDEKGVYSFKNISPGEYILKVEAYGYQSIEEPVTIASEAENIINKSLSKAQIIGKVTTYNTIKSKASILQSTQVASQSTFTQSNSKILSLKQTSLLPKYKKSEIIIKYKSLTSDTTIAKLTKKNKLRKLIILIIAGDISILI